MPPPLYERMFPLTVTPKPKETVRVGVIFDTLPGCDERLSWLPRLKIAFETWGRQLGNADAKTRATAAAKLARQGDLAHPVLEDLVQNGSPVTKAEARKLLESLQPEKVEGPLVPTSNPSQWFRGGRRVRPENRALSPLRAPKK